MIQWSDGIIISRADTPQWDHSKKSHFFLIFYIPQNLINKYISNWNLSPFVNLLKYPLLNYLLVLG